MRRVGTMAWVLSMVAGTFALGGGGAGATAMDVSDPSFIAGITINKLTGWWSLPPDCWIAKNPPPLDSNGRCTETTTTIGFHTGFQSIPSVFSTSPDPNRPHYNDKCTAVNAYVSTAVPPRGVTCSFSDLGTFWNPDDPTAPVEGRFNRGQVWDYFGCDRWKSYIGTDSFAHQSGDNRGWYKDTSGATFRITRATLSATNFRHDMPSAGWEQWDAVLDMRGVSSSSNGLTYQIVWHLQGTIKASYNTVDGGCQQSSKLWDFQIEDLTGTGSVSVTADTTAA